MNALTASRTAASRQRRGTALAAVIVALGILTAITGTVLFVVMNRYHTVYQSSVWQEAIVAAEAGVHQGLAQLEGALKQNVIPTGTQTFTLELPHAGESSSKATVQYTLTRNDLVAGSKSRPYFSIISTGTVTIPGGRSLSMDGRDVILRKLNLQGSNRQASRTIEAWIRPVYSTAIALHVEKLINLNNHKITVDSFDSDDPNRSLAGGQPGTMGQFNVAPYNQLSAHIATNAQFISAGNATVYGDAMTNGGTVGGSSGIMGEIRDDFYQALAPVYPPAWASSVAAGITSDKHTSVVNLTSSATLKGGTASAPARYVLDSVSLTGSSDILTFDLGTSDSLGTKDPAKKHVELYIRGDLTTKGGSSESGTLIVNKGMDVKIWVLGSANFSGNGIANEGGVASALSLYGVNAPTPTANQSFTLAGSAQFVGSLYAPGADLKLSGGGSNGMFIGSLVAKSATLNGGANIRYDEALVANGPIKRFEMATWFEDTKKQGSFPGKL